MTLMTTAGRTVLFALIFAPVFCPRLFATDDHNPIGTTGVFEGVTTTGGAYNVVSHNATRQIDDIVVPGAIGKYGLKMTRYYKSRSEIVGGLMGAGWTHGYQWGTTTFDEKVFYPNGSVQDMTCTGGWNLPGPLAVSDGWETHPSYGNGTFRLADGGTVVFQNHRASSIIDPYGQTITLTYDGTGLLTTVTEPGQRYLQFTYSVVNGVTLLHEVDAYDGPAGHQIDSVVYNYTSEPTGGQYVTTGMCLTSVNYSDSQTASYTYTTDNVPDHLQPPCPCTEKILPLIYGCDDVRYHGAMRRIAYGYQGQGPHGAILNEKYWDGVPGHEANGPTVSSINPPAPSPLITVVNFDTTYTETRGDGPSRTFNYTSLHLQRSSDDGGCPIWDPNLSRAPQQFLQSYTDFSVPAHTTILGYNGDWYVNSVQDANGNITTYTRGPPPYVFSGSRGVGQITQIMHVSDGTHIDYVYDDESPNISGHYVHSVSDERGNMTTYTRDSFHRVTRIDYPSDPSTPASYEQFTYNNFGQVLTHRLRNGAWETFVYDGRGLLTDRYNPKFDTQSQAPGGSDPHTHYDYYTVSDGKLGWIDRVKKVTLPNNTNNLQATETYEYDVNGTTAVPGRGLVTKITHADGKYQSFGYDAYGNKLWQKDELLKQTSYTYDDYKRVLTIKDPLGQISGHTTTYTYNSTNGSNTDPRLHTTDSPDTVTTPTGIQASNVYDQNFRKTSSSVAGLTTWFNYDPVGNQTYVTDPRGTSTPGPYTTYTDYDARNRKSQVRAPLSYTTQFLYEDGLNMTKIVRAYGTQQSNTETKAYDAMNRVLSDAVQKSTNVYLTTWFTYNPSGTISQITDARGSQSGDPTYTTSFYYDASDRKIQMTYPGGSNQQWSYDDAGNLASRTTVKSVTPRETQSFGYDNRNRKTSMSWSNSAEWATYSYDFASRLTEAKNGTGSSGQNVISDVVRQYDDANHLTLDQQTVTGLTSSQSVTYQYDDDGKATRMYVQWVSGYDFTYSYDAMGRFEKIFLTGNPNNTLLFQYYYDAASNEKERDNIVNGVNQLYPRDALNRMQNMNVIKGTTLAEETYSYDGMNRVSGVTYNYGPADSFQYYLDGELNTATVSNPSHTLTYNFDNKGNRMSVLDTANPTTTYSPNPMDQYTSVSNNSITNGSEHEIQTFNAITYNYINDERLSSVASGSTTYSMAYDALGRCVKRTLTGAPATYYIYDGEKAILEYDVTRPPGTVIGTNLYGKGVDEILERAAVDANGHTWVYFPQENHEGSVTLLTDTGGAVLERYRYDAFGAPTIYTPTWATRSATLYDNRFLFTSREYSATYRFTYTTPAFNFYEYRARAYNPKLGRFMSEDPKLFDAGDYNLFRYCHNDPVDMADPMGTDFHSLSGYITPEFMQYLNAQLAKQVVHQIAQLQALVHAMEYPGHGAIGIGMANSQIGQLQGALSTIKTSVHLYADPKVHYENTPTVTKRDGYFGPVQVPVLTRPTVDPVTQSERQRDGSVDVYQRVAIDTRIGTSATLRQRELEMTNVRALVGFVYGHGTSDVRNALSRMQIHTSMEAEKAVYDATVQSLGHFMNERALEVDSPLGEHVQ
jgi:RHS repeat-associated protein